MKQSPVYHTMNNRDTFDITLISVIDMLIKVLIERNPKSVDPVRLNRLESIQNLVDKVEKSYKGYIVEEYINRSTKFVKYMHADLNSLLQDLPKVKKP